jgi:hypothetical protein
MNPEELADNPFLVLSVEVSATRTEVERAGQKLLGQLALGIASVKTYQSPFGLRERDESKVRLALSILRDPEQRAFHELWLSDAQAEQPPGAPGWPNALSSIGWRGPCTE